MQEFYSMPDTTFTVIRQENPRIIVSDHLLSVPPFMTVFPEKWQNDKYVTTARKFYEQENIGFVVNLANDIKETSQHSEVYDAMGILYTKIGIDDSDLQDVPQRFAEGVVEILQKSAEQHHHSKTILLACFAGINRSCLAAAIMLWELVKEERHDPSPQSIIEEIRSAQYRDRGERALTNDTFVDFFKEYAWNSLH